MRMPRAIVPTYDNLKGFAKENLEGYEARPELLDAVMTPEYSREYAGLVRGMPEAAWDNLQIRNAYLRKAGLDSDGVKKFNTRMSVQNNTGANEHYTGNGLTKTTSSTPNKPVYGTVELFSLHKNPKSFRQMTGIAGDTKWVELVDLEPINFGD